MDRFFSFLRKIDVFWWVTNLYSRMLPSKHCCGIQYGSDLILGNFWLCSAPNLRAKSIGYFFVENQRKNWMTNWIDSWARRITSSEQTHWTLWCLGEHELSQPPLFVAHGDDAKSWPLFWINNCKIFSEGYFERSFRKQVWAEVNNHGKQTSIFSQQANHCQHQKKGLFPLPFLTLRSLQKEKKLTVLYSLWICQKSHQESGLATLGCSTSLVWVIVFISVLHCLETAVLVARVWNCPNPDSSRPFFLTKCHFSLMSLKQGI